MHCANLDHICTVVPDYVLLVPCWMVLTNGLDVWGPGDVFNHVCCRSPLKLTQLWPLGHHPIVFMMLSICLMHMELTVQVHSFFRPLTIHDSELWISMTIVRNTPSFWFTKTPHILPSWMKWGVLCQKQVSRAVTSNFIPQIPWDVITWPCPWYLLLTQHTSIIQYLLCKCDRKLLIS